MAWLTDRRLLFAAALAWLGVALIGLVFGPPLGHDEAAFAVTANGHAPSGAWLYRSEGTVAIAKIGIALGGADWQLRLTNTVINTALVFAAFAVGRSAGSARTGAWAAALLAGAHPMALRNAELLGDLPATACVLAAIAILVGELDRADGPRWRIVAAGPVFAAAFYLRYGSAPIVAFALAVAMLMWWRAVLARPLRIVVMVVILALLLIPHLMQSLDRTGSLLGILSVSAGMPRRAYVGEGLVTYFTSNPFMFYGFLLAPVMIAGLVGLPRIRRRAPWYLAIVALGQMFSLGLQSHGQPRYVFVATALLVVVGVDVLAGSRWANARVALGLVVASWLGVVVAASLLFRHLDDTRAPLVEAARVIRADTGERSCSIVAMIVPQLLWYSECQVFASGLLEEPLRADDNRYAVWLERWPIDLPALLAGQHLQATTMPMADPRVRVWRLH